MTIHFITVEIELQETLAQLHSKIEAELQNYGEPLRWAVTAVDVARHTATIEAAIAQSARCANTLTSDSGALV